LTARRSPTSDTRGRAAPPPRRSAGTAGCWGLAVVARRWRRGGVGCAGESSATHA
jgi:hypothetical protein